MTAKNIQATVKWIDLEMGFYGLVDQNGNKWLPINLPQRMQQNGLTVNVKVQVLHDAVTTNMWGTAVELL